MFTSIKLVYNADTKYSLIEGHNFVFNISIVDNFERKTAGDNRVKPKLLIKLWIAKICKDIQIDITGYLSMIDI